MKEITHKETRFWIGLRNGLLLAGLLWAVLAVGLSFALLVPSLAQAAGVTITFLVGAKTTPQPP